MKNKQVKMKVSSVSSAGDGPSTSPAVKKLKQARLPFQIISSDAVKPLSAPPKKRKLSEEHEESPNKIGKTSKNIEETPQEKPVEPVVISDDEDVKSDSVDSSNESPRTKVLNPFVSIVGVALKRKLRKRSTPPKKKVKKLRKAAKKSIETASEKVEANVTNDVNISEDKNETINLDEGSKDVEPVITKEEKQNNSIETSDHRIENKENIGEVECIEELSSGDEAETSEAISKEIESSETKCGEVPSSEVKLVEKVCVESESNSNDVESETISDDNLEEEKDNITVDKQDVEDDDAEEREDSEKNAVSEVDCSSNHGDGSSSECSKDDERNGDDKMKSPLRKRNIAPSDNEFATPKSRSKKENSDTDSTKEPSSSEKNARLSPRTPTVDSKKLTPKQIQKRLDSIKKQQEREKVRLEKEKKKQDEKDEKNRQRLEKEEEKKKEREEKEEQKKKEREEKERLKEQEKKEREEKEEAKRKEKEEKELQKKREKETKEEERKKKEIEREEEKRKKEIEKEEQQSKKKKASAAFVNFFVPKDKSSSSRDSDSQHYQDVVKNDFLSNFTKKSDMRLAPVIRCHLNDDQKATLEEHITSQKVDKDGMYISLLKNKDYEKGRYCPTWPLEEVNNDVIIVEDELPMDSLNSIVMEECPKQTLRAKMFSFSENRRPPYWGTWRRKSNLINGRKPFGVDSSILDYECDSDEEWEEEEPGESVGGSVAGGSDDEEGENDYDVDNEFMVPHGYLSEEEAMGEEDEQILSPEIQKAKLKILQCEFENEMKKSTERLHPRLLGILWQKSDGSKPDSCSDTVWNFLGKRKILCQEEQIFIQPTAANNYCEADETKTSDKPKKSRKISEGMIPDLIRLVHGNTNSRGFLAHEFQMFISKSSNQIHSPEKEEGPKNAPVPVSKLSIAKKIKDISKWMSCPEEGPMLGKMCWFITKEVREQFKVEMELPNQWSYALTPKRRSEVAKKEIPKTPQQPKVNPELVKSAAKEPAVEKKDGAFDITKFTKKLTQEERNKQFVSAIPTPSVLNNGNDKEVPQVKKRVSLLFSGPIGKSLPTSSKDAAVTSDKEGSSILLKDSPGNDTKKEDPPKDTVEVQVAEKKPASNKRKQEMTKKRVALISVPKNGPDPPKIIKANLLTQFIKSASNLSDKSGKNKKETPMETDDCVVLSD